MRSTIFQQCSLLEGGSDTLLSLQLGTFQKKIKKFANNHNDGEKQPVVKAAPAKKAAAPYEAAGHAKGGIFVAVAAKLKRVLAPWRQRMEQDPRQSYLFAFLSDG